MNRTGRNFLNRKYWATAQQKAGVWHSVRRYRFDGDPSTHKARAKNLATILDEVVLDISTHVWEPCGQVALDIHHLENRKIDDINGILCLSDGGTIFDQEWRVRAN